MAKNCQTNPSPMAKKEGDNMNIRQIIEKGAIELKINGIEMPKTKARMLIQFILNKPRQYIIVNDQKNLEKETEETYFKCIDMLKQGMPIEHITHQKEFMKLNFYVDENVLIPRQDTEILVEEVIDIAKKIKAKKILDLCTGSGAIAVSLAKYIDNCEVTALDISPKALEIAKLNAKNNEVENKITFIESDIFGNLPLEKYDIIVSNPPYIKKEIIKTLNKDVQREPRIALDGGDDGLDFYRKIIKESYEYLKFKGYLCLEIGYDQKKDVIQLINQEDKYINTYSKKDLFGNDRIVVTILGK